MKVLHKRIANVKKGSRAYCISHVYFDGVYSHDVIEDYDRGLDQSMTEEEIAKIKIKHKTAIPTGLYLVKTNITSGTFSQKPYYKALCGGKVPRMDPVKGFAGILQHTGVDENSSSGCLIVGYNKKVGQVTDSKKVFERILKVYQDCAKRKEPIEYEIVRTYKV